MDDDPGTALRQSILQGLDGDAPPGDLRGLAVCGRQRAETRDIALGPDFLTANRGVARPGQLRKPVEIRRRAGLL
ncbi:MAG: hypothetical protein KDI42_03775 [Gammaproteobacteria bacterium]|nr:hypothetical protein [Gammaproteobacteria bacterium]